jgi:hypothetical protein
MILMSDEELFKAKIVYLILSQKPEGALESLGKYYHVEIPRLKVGMPKKHGKNAGCYVSSRKTIFVSDRDNLYNPYLILHEFYHHLRTNGGKHRGTEKNANKFAEEHIEAYKTVTSIS